MPSNPCSPHLLCAAPPNLRTARPHCRTVGRLGAPHTSLAGRQRRTKSGSSAFHPNIHTHPFPFSFCALSRGGAVRKSLLPLLARTFGAQGLLRLHLSPAHANWHQCIPTSGLRRSSSRISLAGKEGRGDGGHHDWESRLAGIRGAPSPSPRAACRYVPLPADTSSGGQSLQPGLVVLACPALEQGPGRSGRAPRVSCLHACVRQQLAAHRLACRGHARSLARGGGRLGAAAVCSRWSAGGFSAAGQPSPPRSGMVGQPPRRRRCVPSAERHLAARRSAGGVAAA